VKRRKTTIVAVGQVKLGSGYPIVIQSMTKVSTTDTVRCIKQIKQLTRAGAGLVRIAVPTRSDTKAFAKLVPKVSVPLVADVHFSPARAIEAIEAGAAKIRLNPGNIKRQRDIHRIIDAAKMQATAVRIGVNEASIRDMRSAEVPVEKRVSLMIKELTKYIRLCEKRGFHKIVLSAKSSDVSRTIQVNRRIAEQFDYPIHLGLTHAGLAEDAIVPTAITLGALLLDGIGDTVRVSIAGNPIKEVEIAKDILMVLGLYKKTGPQLIVCPSCARAQADVVRLARQVQRLIKSMDKSLRVAVMGCVVNGPGEAADADIAVCMGKNKGWLYRNGRKILLLPYEKIMPALKRELENF